jgi:predicted ABC-type ATPase
MTLGFLICGPSGVGKTTNYERMLHAAGIKKKLFLIDPDLRKESTHEERSRLALEDVHRVISEGKSFAYTATCGGMRILNDLIRRMKGYHVVVSVVYTSLPTALERIRKRSQQVPDDVVEDLHAFFKSKAERFMKLPVDIYLYNNETDFHLVWSKKNKKVVCLHPESVFYFDISRYC